MKAAIILLSVILLMSGCATQEAPPTTPGTGQDNSMVEPEPEELPGEPPVPPGSDIPMPPGEPQDGFFPLDEVAVHATPEDCWMTIDARVYDVTDYVSSHPGGQTILEGCGVDATMLFETRPMGDGTPHPAKARQILEEYYLGELSP